MGWSGLRVVLVAKFNQRYHRTGGAIHRALTALGADVTPVEERDRGMNRLMGRSLASRLGVAVERDRPDLVLVFKGGSLAPSDIRSLRRARETPLWVNWFPDSPHLLDLSLENARGYHRSFIFDTYMVDRHRASGLVADYLAEGCEPEYHRPLVDPTIPRANVVFVGSKEPFRAAVLESIADLGLALWGPDYPAGPLYGDDFVRAFSNAEIALNIHQFFGEPPERGRYGNGANRRTFELAAIGTLQVCDAKADVGRNFTEDREIVLFRSASELREKLSTILGSSKTFAPIAIAARVRALREHTWGHRLEQLLTMTFSGVKA